MVVLFRDLTFSFGLEDSFKKDNDIFRVIFSAGSYGKYFNFINYPGPDNIGDFTSEYKRLLRFFISYSYDSDKAGAYYNKNDFSGRVIDYSKYEKRKIPHFSNYDYVYLVGKTDIDFGLDDYEAVDYDFFRSKSSDKRGLISYLKNEKEDYKNIPVDFSFLSDLRKRVVKKYKRLKLDEENLSSIFDNVMVRYFSCYYDVFLGFNSEVGKFDFLENLSSNFDLIDLSKFYFPKIDSWGSYNGVYGKIFFPFFGEEEDNSFYEELAKFDKFISLMDNQPSFVDYFYFYGGIVLSFDFSVDLGFIYFDFMDYFYKRNNKMSLDECKNSNIFLCFNENLYNQITSQKDKNATI